MPKLFTLLLDYRKYSGHSKNRQYKYCLTMIDGFSKYAYTVPLKTKKAVEVAAAIDDVLSNISHSYTFFGSDRGSGNILLSK